MVSGLVAAPAGIPFGQYTLGKRLARGGMAEVFLARQRGVEGFDRRVAVKRILPHLADSAEFIRMFLDEARYAARLSHPNIVHIYELGQADATYFIAMEFVDGVHTGQLIRHAAGETIPPVLVARIAADAAGALAYAHRLEDADGRPLGLVHRDVSPQNVMISFDGVVKLVDFGIAKAASSADETQPGIVKGKYAYMSPEQTMRKPLDGRSDVFSLGVVMWEMLAGRNIVDRGNIVEAMKVMRDARFPRIEQVAPHVPPPLAAAVGWALSKNRDDRPGAAQLQAALEEFIKQSPVLATPLQLADWIRPRFARTATTGAQPTLDDSGDARRGAGTKVVEVTGSSVMVPPPRAVTPAPARSPSGGSQPFARVTPPPMPRPPTVDDFTVAEIPPDLGVGDGTTRVIDVRSGSAMHRARPNRGALWAAAIGGLVAAGALIALLVSGALSEPDDLPAVAGDAAPAVAIGLPVDAANPLVVVRTTDGGAGPPIDAAGSPREVVDATESGAPVAPLRATLEVITRPPGARVIVDREPPRTSPVILRDRPPGSTTITVTKDGYATAMRTVVLEPGQHRSLEIVLEKKSGGHGAAPPRTGFLTARTQPYSVVYLGSRKLGETPFAAIELPAGRHVLTFKHPGRRPVTRTVTIEPGKTVKLNFAL